MPIVEMYVHMDCAGCEDKIRKSLQKLEGVDEIDIDMGMQKVTVMGWATQNKVLKAVKKTGRRAEFWPFPYNPEINNFDPQNYYSNNNNRHEHNENYYFHQPNYTHHSYELPQIPSSYPYYYKQGYSSNDDYGYFHHSPPSTMVDDQASSIFSDDNPHACSIM
ncbi:heavy metal-associated isoprenylated plant protein 28 [Eucalyptus grandis]|uniref:heavy metal-associated isoprenylated plant protein 28 n=1 Tax=Eucalyptus grandis TaxID=71139 RepID=UPI00192EFDFD|nr:heavy metal-associated isoprenylated plant protein 28 [Eucalyptus grandis]